MKSFTHKIFALTALFLLFVCVLTAPPAWAQDVSVVNTGATNTWANLSTNTATIGSIIDIGGQFRPGIRLKFQGNGSATDNIVVQLARSADGTTVETTPPASPSLRFTNALNNTTAVIADYALDPLVVGPFKGLKVVRIENLATSVSATNCSISLIKKDEKRHGP